MAPRSARYGSGKPPSCHGWANALKAEAVDVGLVSRMLERAKEKGAHDQDGTALPANVVQGRFSRDASEFSSGKKAAR